MRVNVQELRERKRKGISYDDWWAIVSVFCSVFFFNEFFDHILFCQSTLGQDLSLEQRIHLLMFLVSELKFDIFLVIKGWLLTLLL